MWEWIATNTGPLTLVATVLPVVWAVVQYIQARRAEAKRVRFETYHRLVKELVDHSDARPMIDRQMAVVFELRGFPHYYPVSLRILRGLKDYWSNTPNGELGANARLIDEIDLAIESISRKWWRRNG